MTDLSVRINQLAKKIGEKKLTFEPEDRICYSYDASFYRNTPEFVIFPESEQDLIDISKFSWETGFPIIARGMGSGFTGGTIPVDKAAVVSFEKLNKINKIDEKRFIAVVEPGVITGDIKRQLKKFNLEYPPDPSSSDYSSIGGNIAECAGGLRGLKYGVTKNYCLGIEFIAENGEKYSTGIFNPDKEALPNLKSLFIGSEGTLVLFSKIALKLLKSSQKAATILIYFKNVESAAKNAENIILSGILPSVLEIVDKSSIQVIKDYTDYRLPEKLGAFLLIELDEIEKLNQINTNIIKDIIDKDEYLEFKIAQNEDEKIQLWKLRKAISPALRQIAPDKINEDIAVPRSKVSEIFNKINNLSNRYSIPIPSFGHIGDGNLHVNIMIDKKDRKQRESAEKALEELFNECLKLGGTLSGEHGIGLAKKSFFNKNTGISEIDISKKIKNIFNEKNNLNPGKIFD